MQQFEKLKLNRDFKRLYYKGSAFVSSEFVLYVGKGRKGKTRLGITATKKLGTAVKRNRAKRVVTAAFRSCVPHIPMGYDFVIVARTRILDAKSNIVAEKFKKHLKNGEIWCEDEHN
ncbi:MAG: ribonuclease P protein component [Clostridia bacterium]|nr:ribonuclease P protein component [Clostridia bacterium]